MIKAEFKRLFHKKSFFVLAAISLLLVLSWVCLGYISGSEALARGIPYAETTLRRFEPQNIFFQSMLQVTLTVYIFPHVIMGVIIIYDDLKEKTLLQITVSNRNRKKYLITKIKVLLIYNLAMAGICFLLCLIFAFLMPNINSSNWATLISIHTPVSFIMFWLGLSFWGLVAMTITCLTNSGIGGSCVALYLLIERMYAANTAVFLHNPTFMRINEFLPWANFNTFFVYASNLRYLLSDLSEAEIIANASGLTMYKMMEYNGTMVPYPFFKSIGAIIAICLLFTIIVLGILYYSYNRRTSKM